MAAGFLVLGCVILAATRSGAAEEQKLPLPRFVSLDSSEVNLRAGPGKDYPILWIYQRKGLPVEIIQEFDTWRRIKDRDGTVGWVQQNLISGRRTGQILGETGEVRTMRASPESGAAPVAHLQPGVLGRVLLCRDDDWCRLDVQGYVGWLQRDEFWGTYEQEVFEND